VSDPECVGRTFHHPFLGKNLNTLMSRNTGSVVVIWHILASIPRCMGHVEKRHGGESCGSLPRAAASMPAIKVANPPHQKPPSGR
jgi:hypothetical protein